MPLYLDTNWLEDPADWNRRPAAEIEATAPALGIARGTTVVLYGRDTEGDANEKWPGRRAGQIAATRAALILRYAGVDDVRLLDGGYDRWVTRRPSARNGAARTDRRCRPSACRSRSGPSCIVDIDDAKRILADDQARAGQRSDVARAHRRGQRLQLHRPGRSDRRRRVGQLRHRRVPHAALPQCRQHDAGVSGDRGQLGPGRHPARQVGRVLLRDRLAGRETWFYAYLHGLGPDRRVRRRLVRVEPGPDNNPIQVGEPEDVVAA